MLRFYYCKSEARPEEMSPPSLRAWNVCRSVVSKFSKSEQDVIRTHFTLTWEENTGPAPYTRTAERNAIPEKDVRIIIDRCIRMVAVERGLADE